ncbi:hypothetical protein ACFOND_13820 [Reinekea marina]|uniref:SMI1/KNR4 family protein SUKH-1 n=1 Tax=Reinekea marina TaxID=1310421 RepID=A0ABV7WXW8_9GAMM
MSSWKPITLNELEKDIWLSEQALEGPTLKLWELLKVKPTKWKCPPLGDEGGGFWVVALAGNKVIWYNDIEEGFNISNYRSFGEIEEYYTNQLELFELINSIESELHRNS